MSSLRGAPFWRVRAAVFAGVGLLAGGAVVAGAGCDQGPAPAPVPSLPGRAVDSATPWSRGDLGVRASASSAPAATGSGSGATEPAATVDLEAREDLVRAASSAAPGPTDPNGGLTLIGTDTGAPGTASAVTVLEPPSRIKKAGVLLGDVDVQAEMASPAIEREARGQLYFPLVTRCRDDAGKILPPDAILLEFTIDVDGYIVPQNISATAVSPAYKAAAECMRRELSGLPFRGPPGARGQDAQVKMTIPSVD